MKRTKRRQRGQAKNRANKQAKALILDSWTLNSDTWGGNYCPECYRRIPSRFLKTYKTEPMQFVWEGIELTGHLTFGGRCDPIYCVKNDARYPINQTFKKYTEEERGL